MKRLLIALAVAVVPLTAAAANVRIAVGRGPCCIVVAGDAVWVGNHRDVSVQRIDPTTDTASPPIVVAKAAGASGGGSNLSGLVTDGKALFAIDGGAAERSVTRINPMTHARIVVRLGNVRVLPFSIAVAGGSVWVTSSEDAELWQFDPATLALRSTTSFANAGPLGTIQLNLVAASPSALWGVDDESNVLRIDPRTRKIVKSLRIFAGGSATGALSDRGLWLASTGQHFLARIDTKSGRLAKRVALGRSRTPQSSHASNRRATDRCGCKPTPAPSRDSTRPPAASNALSTCRSSVAPTTTSGVRSCTPRGHTG
jgi:hypothetical protein